MSSFYSKFRASHWQRISFIVLCSFGLLIACSNKDDDGLDNNDDVTLDHSTNMGMDSSIFEGKMTGISFESPPDEFPPETLEPIANVNAEWMAISPFGYSFNGAAEVQYNSQWQWWGETVQGSGLIADYAIAQGTQVMMKPQVWINGGGWVGTYDLETEEEWLNWESTYQDFILEFAHMSADKNIPVFCVGTEYKIAAVERADFWVELIDSIRTFYDGDLVYASNWDNYQNIPFWDKLDYIGIDAYFPLVESATPEVDELLVAWEPLVDELEAFSQQYDKEIIFTEYGYMSVDYTAWQNWENEGNVNNIGLNLNGQSCAFEAFFQALWAKDWFKGGFIWKWHSDYPNAGGENDKDYTPQNKPVEEIIAKWYGL